MVKKTLAQNGLIYIFGCGHSHILAEEAFYRAGGLVNVVPVFYEPLMLHKGAAESSRLEKQPGLAEKVLEKYHITAEDLFVCISTSGINAVPVEVAEVVHSQGIPTVAICSSAYFASPTNSPNGKHLYEAAYLWLDNLAPHGDATLSLSGTVRMAPLSTITGAFLLTAILAEGSAQALEEGIAPPVYRSGNIPGGAEFNRALISRFRLRNRHL